MLGSHILVELISHPYHVKALSRNSKRTQEELKAFFNLIGENPSSLAKIEFIEGDLLELDSLQLLLEGADIIIHSAASVGDVGLHRNDLLKINAEGTANLANSLLAQGYGRLIHISSIATLGPNPDGLSDEDYFFKASPLTTDYAISKYAAEQEVWRAIEEGLDAAILNPSFIIGPSVSGKSSSSVFTNLLKGLPAFTEGRTGYVDVRDVAKAACMLAESDIRGKRFICSAENLMVSQFLSLSAEGLHVKPPGFELKPIWFRLASLIEGVGSFLTRRKPRFNLQTLRMVSGRQAYDGTRICQALKGFTYTPVKDSVEYSCAEMLKAAQQLK